MQGECTVIVFVNLCACPKNGCTNLTFRHPRVYTFILLPFMFLRITDLKLFSTEILKNQQPIQRNVA